MAALIKAAKANRHGVRDALMISLAYHHGLRVTELVELRWNAIDFKRVDIAINTGSTAQRATGNPCKNLRALRALKREAASEEYVFVSERGGPMTRDGFNKLLKTAADRRAGCGYLASRALRIAASTKRKCWSAAPQV